MIAIELPYPPSLNHYYRHVGAKVLISAKGREYKRAVGVAAMVSRLKQVAGPVEVELYISPPDKRRRDVDNVSKCLLDSLKEILFEDDSCIDRLTLVRLPVKKPGSVLVRIRSAGKQEVPSDG